MTCTGGTRARDFLMQSELETKLEKHNFQQDADHCDTLDLQK